MNYLQSLYTSHPHTTHLVDLIFELIVFLILLPPPVQVPLHYLAVLSEQCELPDDCVPLADP